MLVLDRAQFLFALTGAAVRGDWTAAALRAALAATGYDLRAPGLAPRILKTFPTKPTYGTLFAFLVGDARLSRALGRPVAPRRSPAPPPTPLAALQLPHLPTEAALAAWLNFTPGRLRWLADLTGRNRRHPPGPLRTYRHRWVAKPSGRARLLEIPVFPLKQAQRHILAGLLTTSRRTPRRTASVPAGPPSRTRPSTAAGRSS